MTLNLRMPEMVDLKPRITVFGIGGAGGNAVNNMIDKALDGVECRKDAGVLDETPSAYKPIEQVMEAQKDLVEIVHTLKQVVCVKG